MNPRRLKQSIALAGTCVLIAAAPAKAAAEPRARDWGIPFEGEPGPRNAITDIDGVMVGHQTLIAGEGALKVGQGPVRTGVTAILPTGRDYRPVFAATAQLNGNGEMTGTSWIDDSGYLREPILLTNTHSIGAVHEAVIRWRAAHDYYDGEAYTWASLPVVAETWDGRLNDIHGFHVEREDVFAALNRADGGPVPEGNVGGGTGMVCYELKGGIGTASRRLSGGETVGVLVQANYGRRETLRIAGVPVGRELSKSKPIIHGIGPVESDRPSDTELPEPSPESVESKSEGSIIVIVATDLPLLPDQLERVAGRVPLGIGRLGGLGRNSSGDFFLAFSTAEAYPEGDQKTRSVTRPANAELDAVFQATVQATEEAVVNALVAAETMTGINGNTVFELPEDRLKGILRRYNRLDAP